MSPFYRGSGQDAVISQESHAKKNCEILKSGMWNLDVKSGLWNQHNQIGKF